jgi:hypothetical protein
MRACVRTHRYGLYEVVVWTNSYSMSADPWIEKLDPIMLTAQNQIAVRSLHTASRRSLPRPTLLLPSLSRSLDRSRP